jgi:hypothetical protein
LQGREIESTVVEKGLTRESVKREEDKVRLKEERGL